MQRKLFWIPVIYLRFTGFFMDFFGLAAFFTDAARVVFLAGADAFTVFFIGLIGFLVVFTVFLIGFTGFLAGLTDFFTGFALFAYFLFNVPW